jgi:hypothetical protein
MPAVRITRHEFLKFIGIGVAAGFLASCTPRDMRFTDAVEQLLASSTPSWTPISTPLPSTKPPAASPTFPPLPSNTPVPTEVPTQESAPTEPVPTEETGETQDILTREQKERLNQEAVKYIAHTEVGSIEISNELAYLPKYAHPSTVCGPLSIAILRDAGLVSQYIDIHAFWLLDPREAGDMAVLERTFPREEFIWFTTKESTRTFDFSQYPLKAGDFVYLYSGDSGTFEHMLTVSRVDEQGRAFSVSNHHVEAGYLIEELMLYDPALPGVGKIYDWTDRKNWKYGLTGFGGFSIWRFQAPVIDPTPQEVWLADQVDQVLGKYGGRWFMGIKQVGKNYAYSRWIREPIHPASVIKVPIAMLFMKSLENKGITDFDSELKKGRDDRSYWQLLTAMLVESEEEATQSIIQAILDNHLNIVNTLEAWGATSTDVIRRYSSVRELTILFEGLYSGSCLTAPAQKIILDLMQVFTPNDELRFGGLRHFLPVGYPVYNKRGTITNERLIVADFTLVTVPTSAGDQAFVLGAFGYPEEGKTTFETLEAAFAAFPEIFWEYTRRL